MKNKVPVKQLFPAVFSGVAFLLSIVMFACFSTSFGWFSTNRKTTSHGLSMGTEVTANLVIADAADTTADIQNPKYLKFSIDFPVNETRFAPATHDSAYSTGLKYVTNETQIDYLTGLRRTGSTVELTYADAANVTDGTQYYVEKTVYVAANGKEIPSAALYASISSATVEVEDEESGETETVDVTSGTLMAASVDFYLSDGTNLTYCGTANVANKTTKVTLLEAGSEIPLNTEGYLTVVMRFYFDGALERTTGQAYVNTVTVSADTVSLDILFEADENAEASSD